MAGGAPGIPIRVLVVDDMPAMRLILRNMLDEMGFERVDAADDGELAWRMLREAAVDAAPGQAAQRPYGLVIADWNMISVSGVELLRSVRSFAPTRSLPFLIVTAEGDRAHLSEALHAGADGYLVKPFTPEDFRSKVNGALKRS